MIRSRPRHGSALNQTFPASLTRDSYKHVRNKMANDAIIANIGSVFHKLFDHRAAMHTEHNFFVKEFEGRRGNQDMQRLQGCMSMLNEIDALFLPEIFTSRQYFISIREQINETASMGDAIMKKEAKYTSKGLSKSEQAKLEQSIQDYKESLLKQKDQYMEEHKKKMEAMTQELEMLQLQLASLGPQKLRGSTVSLATSSSAAEELIDVVSDEEVKSEQPPPAQENIEQSQVNTPAQENTEQPKVSTPAQENTEQSQVSTPAQENTEQSQENAEQSQVNTNNEQSQDDKTVEATNESTT
ncbi:biogenesis of lysosome-related organelles complex 1 subunit 5-like [Dysidea avara]|uniref:biogenesis of lysosome-related organelles complex 1 subunit 5-like n=1 Tax=Dysidea avara TaxID=196820 RepID=UPI003332008E